MRPQKNIEILDCTIRDGGYINDWRFDNTLVREVYRLLSKCGVDYVELGFRTGDSYCDKDKCGVWRYTPEDILNDTVRNIHGARISLMGDYGKVSADEFADKKESLVSMVRIAAHKDKIVAAISELERIKAKGYIASLQCMGYGNYSELEKKELLAAIKSSYLDYVYVADSYGSLVPFEIERLLSPFVELGTTKVGFHPHNNLQMAFANTLEAMRVGADIVDVSVYGMGRGAGNLPSEILLAYLAKREPDKYNVIPALNCIDRYFLDLMKERHWGYQLPYMISGACKSHPYYAKELVDRREYTIDTIWKALEFIEEINPIGFDRNVVNKLIEKGMIGSHGKGLVIEKQSCRHTRIDESRPVTYRNRHVGRNFLVLANGPNLKASKPNIDKFIKKYNPIVLGANYLSDMYEPHYHAFNNEKRFVSYIETVKPNSRLLIGDNIPSDMISEYLKGEYETLRFRNILDTQFDIKKGVVMSNCKTISALLIAVAVVMGAKRVYVAGMDGYMSKESVKGALFYDEHAEPEDHAFNIERHRWNDHFLFQIDQYIQRHGGEGIHIITPTTHSRHYKGIENYV